jgi:mono/diheme cytochrome c family protein
MKTLVLLAGVAALCASGALVAALTGATSATSDDAKFDAARISKGAALAAIGNCGTCHTAEGGKPFAGGRPLSSPFGTI